MSSMNDANDGGRQESQPSPNEQEHAGNSGEGAASALAHLKTQTRQHRRLSGEADDTGGGRSQ